MKNKTFGNLSNVSRNHRVSVQTLILSSAVWWHFFIDSLLTKIVLLNSFGFWVWLNNEPNVEKNFLWIVNLKFLLNKVDILFRLVFYFPETVGLSLKLIKIFYA